MYGVQRMAPPRILPLAGPAMCLSVSTWVHLGVALSRASIAGARSAGMSLELGRSSLDLDDRPFSPEPLLAVEPQLGIPTRSAGWGVGSSMIGSAANIGAGKAQHRPSPRPERQGQDPADRISGPAIDDTP